MADFSEGCHRRMPLCDNKFGKILNFSPLKVIQVGKPDVNFLVNSKNECIEECLKDCNCQAYSCTRTESRDATANTTCWIWSDNLNNIKLDDTNKGRYIHLRVPQNIAAEANQTNQDGGLYNTNKQFQQWPLAVATVIALAFIVLYIYIQRAKVQNKDRGSDLPLRFYDGQKHVKELIDSGGLNDEDKKGIDLPFFDLGSILAATDNFSEANKLGKGGFGPVYKGNFPGGQEIAVKSIRAGYG